MTTAFDYLIVGAGSAGCVLAARLSEDPGLRVALVEAGGEARDPAIADPRKWPRLQGSAIDWAYRTVPQPGTAGRVHDWPRGRVIGGSSCLNAMAHVRGHPSDFDGWAAGGCAGWGYRDLLPYFIRSESFQGGASRYHGDSGPIGIVQPSEPHSITRAFMAAGRERGHPAIADHNGAEMAGVTLNSLTLVDGRRQSAADAYLTPALGRSNLTVLPEARVRRLLVERGRCRAVEAVGPEGPRRLDAERAVILAAGTIGSPLLLMASGIGPAGDLRPAGIEVLHDLPGVGGNLHDHLLSGGNLYRARRPVPPSKYQHSESLLYARRDGGTGAPELVVACVVVPVVTEAFAAPPPGEAYTLMFGFTSPRSRGRIRLTPGDPLEAPAIDPAYLADPYDRAAYLDALELARGLGHARALDDWRAEEILPARTVGSRAGRLAFLERAAFTHHHPVGTCRMGEGPDAVVGPDLKLQGLESLYVVDASVMPAITCGPVNAAVLAIAERGSDLLRGRAPLAPLVHSPDLAV